MNIQSFFSLVEIQTKLASVIPFLLGTAFSVYRYNKFSFTNFFIMFISLISIDMATTALNNFMDYKKAIKEHGYGYEEHNAMVKYNIKEKTALSIIIGLILIAITFGVLLVLRTNIVVLFLGAISFLVAVSYSFGPIPISRTPFGELFSGIFMGFLIPLISILIQTTTNEIIDIKVSLETISFTFSFWESIIIFILAIPPTLCIGNIMLGNNICDIEDDIENKRYTLPIYIGKAKGLLIWKALYYISYISIILLVMLRINPLTSLLVLLTYKPVKENINRFMDKQTKKDTFICSVKNFGLINGSYLITIFLGLIIKKWA
jgi:1,4-dihydroxy-2-naphthoate polyprenyltransferase